MKFCLLPCKVSFSYFFRWLCSLRGGSTCVRIGLLCGFTRAVSKKFAQDGLAELWKRLARATHDFFKLQETTRLLDACHTSPTLESEVVAKRTRAEPVDLPSVLVFHQWLKDFWPDAGLGFKLGRLLQDSKFSLFGI